jgi:hypothetical protein
LIHFCTASRVADVISNRTGRSLSSSIPDGPRRHPMCWRVSKRQGGSIMQTLDDMLSLNLLTANQHAEIRAWVAEADSPEAIMRMPQALWRTLELASVLMGFDADVSQPPLLQFDP